MVIHKVHDEASSTDAEEGVVIIDGPGGLALSMTASAADETGTKLKQSAAKARDQSEGRRPPVD